MIEEQMQAKCFQWFWNTYPSLRKMLHCNMNNQVHKIAGANAKAMGVVAGVSDMELIWTKMWFLEAKMPGGRQTEDQKEFERVVKLAGHNYKIFYSFEEFQQIIWEIIGRS